MSLTRHLNGKGHSTRLSARYNVDGATHNRATRATWVEHSLVGGDERRRAAGPNGNDVT